MSHQVEDVHYDGKVSPSLKNDDPKPQPLTEAVRPSRFSFSEVWQDAKTNRMAYFMGASASFGGMLFGWDTGLIDRSFTLPDHRVPHSPQGGVLTMQSFKISFGTQNYSASQASDLSGNIVSVLQAGCFFGAMSSAYLGDKFGRKPALFIAVIIFLIGSLIQTVSGINSTSLAPLYVGRVIGGFGVGLISAVVPIYISESAPKSIRGRCTGMMQLFNVTGIMLSYWVNYGLSLQVTPVTNPAMWRTAFGLQMLPGVLFVLTMVFQKESPRWLCEKGKDEEARKVIARLLIKDIHDPKVTEALEDIRADFVGRTKLTMREQAREVFGSWSMFYRAFVGVLVMFFQQWTGTNSINYYSPQIFGKLGLSASSSGLLATGVYGAVKVFCTGMGLALAVEQAGRKRSLIVGGLGQAFSMYFIGIYSAIHPSGPIIPASYAAITFVYIYVVFYSIGWGTIPWVVSAEVIPNRLRSFSMSFALMTQWLFNFVIAKITPTLLNNITYGTFLLFGSFCVVMVIWVLFGLPETKGISLEEMDAVFEGSIIRRSLEDNPGASLCGLRRRPTASSTYDSEASVGVGERSVLGRQDSDTDRKEGL